jgi:hypothetical protein
MSLNNLKKFQYLLDSYNEQGTEQTGEEYNVTMKDPMFLSYLEERLDEPECQELYDILTK